jgi:uncharacterized protein (TIGR03663 family)
MERVAVMLGWMMVAAAAVWLRFDDLAERPFHADEATGARITAMRMETGGGKFDPKHYHGPLLGDLAIPLCRARGEDGWKGMSKGTLRLLPACAGVLLVCAPLFWRRVFGDPAALLAGAFLAVSPLLVYYSRMFIHEMLLALLGVLALAAMTRGPRPVAAGILIGLMYATKESFAISMIAWTGAALLTAALAPGVWKGEVVTGFALRWWRPFLTAAALAVAVAMVFYTGFLTYPRGAVDAVMTFFVYETVEGHDKPWFWYAELLAWPGKSGGVWWFGTPLVVLALAAFGWSFSNSGRLARQRDLVRFMAFSAAGHVAIYSVFAYKTPWLACLPWAHVCLLAGFSLAALPDRRVWQWGAVFAVGLLVCIPLWRQARMACGRLASDDRNPYAYVPTRRDVERLESWIQQLRAKAAPGSADTAAVVGNDYWPLPWYLRDFDQVGYWQEPPADLEKMAFVFAMPGAARETGARLADTHMGVPRGLRAEVPLMAHVRKDIWEKWMEVEP